MRLWEQRGRATHSFRVPFQLLVWACGHFPLVIWNTFYERIWKEHIRTWTLRCLVAMIAEWRDTLAWQVHWFCAQIYSFLYLGTYLFLIVSLPFHHSSTSFLYYCSLVNPIYVFLTLCNLSRICDLSPFTGLLSAFLPQWFPWFICVGFSIHILHMNKRKWEVPEVHTGGERHEIMASWEKIKQAGGGKKRCLLKRRLDIGTSYTRGKAGLDENNKKKEGNGCLGD